MSVDYRTRVDGEVDLVDPSRFFAADLPAALDSSGDLLQTIDRLRLRPLVVVVDNTAWTLRHDGDRVSVRHGEAGTEGAKRAVLRLTPHQLDQLVTDQVTPIGLFTAATLDQPEGRIGHVLDWWLVLRAVLDRVPLYSPGSVQLPDDLHPHFTLDDDPAVLRSFLEQAGYLHLRGVFTEAEMAAISADMDTAAPTYRDGDGHSWWATLADGTRRVVRMEGFEQHSVGAAALLDDPRFLAVGAIPGCGHQHRRRDNNRVEALFKPLGVAEGISDVPWHKDCSLGRHSYDCCSLTVGVSVTGAGPTSGQLRVIAGSHRALVWPSLLDTSELGLPDVALATDTGDVTVHLSCTLHMAQPPTERERRVLYTGFTLPSANPAAAHEAQRRLFVESRDAAPRNTSQAAAPTPG